MIEKKHKEVVIGLLSNALTITAINKETDLLVLNSSEFQKDYSKKLFESLVYYEPASHIFKLIMTYNSE